MAASIKMDELLVSWLGSDAVYENVLSLIEKKRSEVEVGGDEEKKSAEQGEEGGDGGGEKDGPEGSSRGAIPPFYVRPPTSPGRGGARGAASGGAGGDGTSAAALAMTGPYRRPRSDSFAEDQTWDGSGKALAETEDATSGGDGSGSPSKESTGGSVASGGALSPGGLDAANPVTEGEPGADGTSSPPATPLPCIRDQVRAIYDEISLDLPPTSPVHRRGIPGDGEGFDDGDGTEEPYNDARYLPVEAFVRITKEVCQFPTFFNGPLYERILDLWNRRSRNRAESGGDDSATSSTSDMTVVTYGMFRWYWKVEMEHHDASERFFRLVKKVGSEYIVRDDFLPYIKELLKDHPGLEFLSNHAEFQEKYAITVITRIFYTVNRCHDGRITSRQIRRSDLLSAFQQVDEEEDINKVTRYFSYEHFYVLYCRFWELDHDRDYRITREDLLKYGDHCLSHMIVDRIFDAAPRPFAGSGPWTGAGAEGEEGSAAQQVEPPSPPLSPAAADAESAAANQQEKRKEKVNSEFLTYEDFIFFMLSEEDKANEISIRYWFSCIDVDGDGRLNNMEMRSFYAVQLHRMQCMGHEIVPFEDMLCQMIDMIKPTCEEHLVPEDFLKQECAQVSGALYDALFNLNKYLMFEQRDPFMERQKREDEFDTDWDRFACIDYNRLAMEEEAREEEAMEIDWVTVDDEDDDGDEFNSIGIGASEAPF